MVFFKKQIDQGAATQLQELFLKDDGNSTLGFAKQNGIMKCINFIEQIFLGLDKKSELRILLAAVLEKIQASGIALDLTSIELQVKFYRADR